MNIINIINITYKSLCRLTGALLFLGLLSGCAQNPVTGGQDFVMISENKELEMGRTYHPQIIEQYGRCLLYTSPSPRDRG